MPAGDALTRIYNSMETRLTVLSMETANIYCMYLGGRGPRRRNSHTFQTNISLHFGAQTAFLFCVCTAPIARGRQPGNNTIALKQTNLG